MASNIEIIPIRCGTVHLPIKKNSLKREALPVWCYLVKHPHGLLLINTGLGMEKLPLHLQQYYRPEIQQEELIKARLLNFGILPEDIDYLLLTHLFPDHTGGLHSLKGVKHILLSEEEYYWTARISFARRAPKALWEGEKLKPFYFRGTSIGPQKHSFDLFGDESVVFVLTPGPTFGMTSIVLNHQGKKVIIAADMVKSPKLMDEGYVYHEYYQRKSVEWLNKEKEAPNCIAVLTTHDKDMTEKPIIL